MGSRIDGPFSYRSDEVHCPICSASGMITWDATAQPPQFITLTGDFFERVSRKAPFPIELVCLRCGTVQPDDSGPVLPSTPPAPPTELNDE